MAQRTCDQPDCDRPHFGRGLCNMHYYRIVRNPRKPVRMSACAWCGERKPISEMRHPNSSRGKTPSTCHACRQANPTMAWCDYHSEPHERSRFTPNPRRPIGVDNVCVQGTSALASAKRSLPDIACAACGLSQPSWNFRGGRAKAATCRTCDEANSQKAWCIDCAEWMPRDRFTTNNRYWVFKYCRPCRTARAHGVSVAFILNRQGSAKPECAACKSVDFLKVDHDHRCCPTSNGCERCVRGYLCHECNTSEGLLGTPDRVRLLLAYMERVESEREGMHRT